MLFQKNNFHLGVYIYKGSFRIGHAMFDIQYVLYSQICLTDFVNTDYIWTEGYNY